MKPIKTLRIGTISLSAWENQGEENKVFHTFTFQRSYKDKDENWKQTQQLRLEDLPKLKILMEEMYKQISLKEVK